MKCWCFSIVSIFGEGANCNAIYVTVGMATACLLILLDMECGNWPVFLQIDIPLLITGKMMRAAAAHFHTCLKAKEQCKAPTLSFTSSSGMLSTTKILYFLFL